MLLPSNISNFTTLLSLSYFLLCHCLPDHRQTAITDTQMNIFTNYEYPTANWENRRHECVEFTGKASNGVEWF